MAFHSDHQLTLTRLQSCNYILVRLSCWLASQSAQLRPCITVSVYMST